MHEIVLRVLIALAAVLIAGRVLSTLFAYVGQPPVIGEVVAGILLGPSLIGHELSSLILPTSVAPYLGVIAQLGVILYMFLVGLELNGDLFRAHAKAALVIGPASVALPFLFGLGLAVALSELGYSAWLAGTDVPFTSFMLFLGIAMAITAFPVLARILSDRRMSSTSLGTLALSCAALGDVTTWCLLALVVGVARTQISEAFVVIGLSALFVTVMIFVGRPLLTRWARHCEGKSLGPGHLAALLILVLLAGLATEAIGIHALFGAFLLGAVIPHDSRLALVATAKLHDLVTILLLPAFFAYTGMRTEIGLVAGLDQWLLCGLIIVVATVGKVGGAGLAARLTGLNWRRSAALGVLMNTRGLMELIVLNLGLSLGVISPTLYAMMVLMALVTTMATSPLVSWLNRGEDAPSPQQNNSSPHAELARR